MKNILLTLLLFILFSCKSTGDKTDCEVLHVDLVERPVPMEELFSKISVIPLETNDSSFLVRPVKVIIKDNRYYIVDEGVPAVFSFDEEGHLLHKIGKKGQGPGEYREVYDMIVDESKNQVRLLSPFGSLYTYDLEGNFIKQNQLPEKSNYQAMEQIGDNIMTWTIPVSSDEPCITIVNADNGKEVSSLWKGPRILNSLSGGSFYTYDGKTYFAPAFHNNEILEVTEDSLKLAYKWDFGKDNIDISKYNFTLTDDNQAEEGRLMTNYLENGTIPYLLGSQYQNSKYFYVCFSYGWFPNQTIKHLFYRKSDGKSFFFKDTQENISIRPQAFEEECIVQFASYDDLEAYKSILSPAEYQKIISRNEEDNPCLIKLYFK